VGEWLVGACGAVLLASLFMPWFDQRVQCDQSPCPPVKQSGWESFAITDVIAAVVAAGALALIVLTARMRSASPSIAYEAMLTLIGVVTFAIVAIRVLSPPFDVAGRGAGVWIGLLAAAGVVAGSLVAMRDERPSRPGHPTDSTGAPLASPRDVETIPAPPVPSS
jgi:hypothetical protein